MNEYLKSIAQVLPVLGIGCSLLLQAITWWSTKKIWRIAALLCGLSIIIVVLLTYPNIKVTPAIQIVSFALIFIFFGYNWLQEKQKIIAWIILGLGVLFLLSGLWIAIS